MQCLGTRLGHERPPVALLVAEGALALVFLHFEDLERAEVLRRRWHARFSQHTVEVEAIWFVLF